MYGPHSTCRERVKIFKNVMIVRGCEEPEAKNTKFDPDVLFSRKEHPRKCIRGHLQSKVIRLF